MQTTAGQEVVLFSNPATEPTKIGYHTPDLRNLTLRASVDAGKTWPVARSILPARRLKPLNGPPTPVYAPKCFWTSQIFWKAVRPRSQN